jgi:CheY-like chemotaxis protein
MLTDLGYQVLQKMDGKGALALLNMTPDVDLLLSDVVLPGGLSGRALAAAARIIRPEIRVLFMSGYTKDTFAVDGHPEPGDQLLVKPFRSTDLAQSIRRALAT